MNTSTKLMLASDYQEGAHPNIIRRLAEINLLSSEGYGTDAISESARTRIRKACQAPDAQVHFLVGGTQTNRTVIDALLASYQGVIAANTGHVSAHEAGAIEAGGHKVLTIPSELGKITAAQIENLLSDFYGDGNRDHLVMPGMVYLSQPTESGTLYTLEELTAISSVCRKNDIPLYIDGARLAYALSSPANDVTLPDLARLCDAFYIGGTKCGALLGEAVVIPDPNRIPHFFTIIKQHGALLAKGWLAGVQFDELFKEDETGEPLYFHIGDSAITLADEICRILLRISLPLFLDTPTNQVFFVIENSRMAALNEKVITSFWEKYDETHTVLRLCTSWATTKEKIEELEKILETI